jgi:hypothetical protein
MSPLKSALSIGRQAPCLPGPLLDVGPHPCRAAADGPARFREAKPPDAPFVDGVPADGQPLSNLHHSDGLAHGAHCTGGLYAGFWCRHNADTTSSGPGAALTARGPATTEVPVMTIADLTRPSASGAPPGGDGPTRPVTGDAGCPACAAAGGICEFHRGWAEGWDACAAFVAGSVGAERRLGGAS